MHRIYLFTKGLPNSVYNIKGKRSSHASKYSRVNVTVASRMFNKEMKNKPIINISEETNNKI